MPDTQIAQPGLSEYRPAHLLLTVADRIAEITLDRPQRKNPLTFESYAELLGLFRAARQDDGVRAIVITGAGGNFSSGGDVHDIIRPLLDMNSASLLRFTRMTGDLVKAMRACPQPVISAVDGVCAGAGAIIAMASDFRLGTAQARVAFLFNRVGLAGCDMGACAVLPRLIGQGRAAELLFTGRTLSGEEGERWGFFNRLAAPDLLLVEARELARSIAEGPGFAHAMTKRMLQVEWAMGLDDAIEAESVAQALCMTTEDFSRAYRAFADKRKPAFEGN